MLAGIECRRDTLLFQLFSDPVGNPWNAQCRRRQSGGSKGSGQCPSARQMTEQMKSSVNVCLLLQAGVLSLLAFVAGAAPDQYPAPGTGGRDEDTKRCAAAVWQLLPAVSGGRLKLSLRESVEGYRWHTDRSGWLLFWKGTGPEGHGFGKTLRDSVFKGLYRTDYTGTAFEEADGESFVQAASLWKLDGNYPLGWKICPFCEPIMRKTWCFTGEGDDAKRSFRQMQPPLL